MLDIVDKEQFPQTYKENTRKEKLVLGYAENFRRQYVHLYRDRKPLFLNPYNECFVEASRNRKVEDTAVLSVDM